METEPPSAVALQWGATASQRQDSAMTWELLKPPLISVLALMYGFRPEMKAEWNSKSVAIIPCIGEQGDSNTLDGLAWHTAFLPPDRIVARRGASSFPFDPGVLPLWTRDPGAPRPTHASGLSCPFPPQWNGLCGVRFENYSRRGQSTTVWNPANKLFQSVNTEGWAWCKESFSESLDPLPKKGSLLIDNSRAASWVLMCLEADQHDIWEGLNDRDPDFLPTLWRVIFEAEISPSSKHAPKILQWVEDYPASRIRVLTPSGWDGYEAFPDVAKAQEFLPDPGSEWSVVISEKRMSSLRKSKSLPRRK